MQAIHFIKKNSKIVSPISFFVGVGFLIPGVLLSPVKLKITLITLGGISLIVSVGTGILYCFQRSEYQQTDIDSSNSSNNGVNASTLENNLYMQDKNAREVYGKSKGEVDSLMKLLKKIIDELKIVQKKDKNYYECHSHLISLKNNLTKEIMSENDKFLETYDEEPSKELLITIDEIRQKIEKIKPIICSKAIKWENKYSHILQKMEYELPKAWKETFKNNSGKLYENSFQNFNG